MSHRRAAALLVLFTAGLVLPTAPNAWAASQAATIASFNYTPNDVQISVGDTVVWRNVDATVHTVTASRGEFSSGSMRQGQEFSATFNVPGVYPYFCEPHESMRGTVSVTGAAPSTTTTIATTTTTLRPRAATTAPATTLPMSGPTASSTPGPTPTATSQPLPADADPASHNGSAALHAAAVVSGGVTGDADQASPALAIAAVLVVAAALAAALRGRLHYVAAVGTAATGLLHAQLRFALDYPEPIGTLLVIEAAGAVILTAWLVSQPWTRTKQITAIAAHVGALVALAITRTSVGLFGFHEIGWDPSPQVPVAVAIGAVVIALLALARTEATGTVA